MNIKEISEIRRRIRQDRTNITKLYGCYVNSQREIVSCFSKSVGMMPENEATEYLGKLKKVLSGGLGKNMLDLAFQTSQVADSAEHKFLMDLRNSRLEDIALVQKLYEKIIAAVDPQDGYLILLGCDSYDVPFKSGEEETGNSGETFVYILCAICPVKLTKTLLQYDPNEKLFSSGGAVNAAGMPEIGFMFPAFDNRSSNIYNVHFYTKSNKESHQELIDQLFSVSAPMPAAQQKKSFETLLTRSLDSRCNMEVVQAVHDQICQTIELHKESRIADPLLISKEQVREILEDCGVPEKNVAKFAVDFDEEFGAEAQLHPKNIINNRKFEVTTPDVVIKVAPDKTDLIETRVIGGVPYILICANENVEVNGVAIHITEEE